MLSRPKLTNYIVRLRTFPFKHEWYKVTYSGQYLIYTKRHFKETIHFNVASVFSRDASLFFPEQRLDTCRHTCNGTNTIVSGCVTDTSGSCSPLYWQLVRLLNIEDVYMSRHVMFKTDDELMVSLIVSSIPVFVLADASILIMSTFCWTYSLNYAHVFRCSTGRLTRRPSSYIMLNNVFETMWCSQVHFHPYKYTINCGCFCNFWMCYYLGDVLVKIVSPSSSHEIESSQSRRYDP